MTQFPRRGLMRPAPGGAFVAENAVVTGDVTLGEQASVWFGSVLRGDDAAIHIGARTNVQDLCMIHPDPGVPYHIGAGVTVGHRVVLHGAQIDDGCLIGMGSVLLTGSRVGAESLVAAGAVVKENFVVPPRTMVAGVPAKIVRELDEEMLAFLRFAAEEYLEKVRQYLADGRS